ncbi:MAG: zinc ribbon domain-containing protein [Planctomycetota bacterium]
MPTYEYVCRKCEHRFERFQSIKAGPVRKCPSCGKASAQRLVSAGGGIIFKGSGFYETDYRSDSYKKGQESETKSSTDKSTTEKKTETKAKDSEPADTPKPAAKDKKKSA